MKCIVGLGNPGSKYESTRHNIGFMVIDELLKRNDWKLDKEKYKGLYTIQHMSGDKLMLIKPLTYMNLSGEAVSSLMDYYEIDLEDLIIIYDDLDLEPGKLRLRQKGGHGGHNGIRSLTDHLGTKSFQRIRLGIGRPDTPMPVPDYVLGNFSKNEQEVIKDSIKRAADACEAWLNKPFLEVMNSFNAK